MSGSVVIIGAGLAGLQTAEALRAGGFGGSITLVGDEPTGPYHRPPLSKAWLAGDMDASQLAMRGPDVLAKKQIKLTTHTRVTAIDRAAKTVALADGSQLPYTGLVLATGSRPRLVSLPGAQAKGVLALRTQDDATQVAAGLARCAGLKRPLVVIGGGFIGLEVAATARKKGIAVTVLEAAPRLLGRVLAPALSDWFANLHRSHGVELVLNAQIKQLTTDADIEGNAAGDAEGNVGESGWVSGVQLADGTLVPAGLVLVGIGALANDELAAAAGIECERGILVDACGRTSDPAVFAAGDCAVRKLPDGTALRLESVQNATEQGKSAAAALLGQERPFTATAWFWSDQYDKKLQMAGLSTGADQCVLRGDMAASGFSMVHLKAGKLVAVDSINAVKDHLQARKLLDAGVSPTPEQAADTGFDLVTLLKHGQAV